MFVASFAFGLGGGGRMFDHRDLGVAEELARRVALAMENAALYQDAADALHARDEFLAVVAHELRGPLMGLRLATDHLTRTRGLPAEVDKPLAIIAREDRRLAR